MEDKFEYFDCCSGEEIVSSVVVFAPYVPLQRTCNMDYLPSFEFDVHTDFFNETIKHGTYRAAIEEILDYINEGPI